MLTQLTDLLVAGATKAVTDPQRIDQRSAIRAQITEKRLRRLRQINPRRDPGEGDRTQRGIRLLAGRFKGADGAFLVISSS